MKEFDKIDQYIMGMLSDQEQRDFLQKVAQDEALAKELALRQQLVQGIREEGRAELKAHAGTNASAIATPSRSCPLPPALALALGSRGGSAIATGGHMVFCFVLRPTPNCLPNIIPPIHCPTVLRDDTPREEAPSLSALPQMAIFLLHFPCWKNLLIKPIDPYP